MGAKVQTPITQMNSGKLAPVMEGRTDVQVYPYSCRHVKNAIPLVYGSNKNRGGSAFVHATASGAKVVLIPFKVGENVAYMLEFGDHVIRFIKDHEMILTTGNLPYEVSTPYALTDLIDSNGVMQLDYQQSGDVIYLVHDKYQPQKLSRYGDTNWTLSALDLQGGPWRDMNIDENLSLQVSGNTGIVSLSGWNGDNPTATGSVTGPSGAGNRLAIYFYIGGWDTAGTQLVGRIWAPSTDAGNYSYAELAAQLINTLPQFVATNPTRSTIKITAIADQASYSNEKFCIEVIYGTTISYSSVNNNGTFSSPGTAVNIFDESWVGKRIRLWQINTTVQTWYTGLSIAATGTVVKSDGHFYSAASTGTCGSVKPTHTEGTASDGGVTWTYIHDGYGWGTIIEYISATEVSMKVESYIPQGIVAVGTYQWELSLLGQDEIWPSSIAFFRDRLVLGVNAKSGPQICFSCTGDYENFSDMTNGEVLATNAITLPILLDLNKIQWLCAQDNLFVGTEGGIVAVKAMTSSEVFGPDNITYDNISSVGACKIKPIRIGDDILYLGRLAKDIYAIQYNWETDSYAPDEVSLLAYDLLEEGISGWALQYEPNRIIWLVRRDGKIVGLTYNKKQSVRAFHLHETDGNFESVASIPAPDGTMDDVYFVAKRTVNSADVRYVEYFKNGLPLNIASGLTQAQKLEYLLKNGWFLDCAKKYTFDEATSAITGLTHLEGKTVSVFADGKVQESKTVVSGAITLDTAASMVLVGLPYETVIEPMPVNIDVGGTGQARSQRINQIVCRLYRSANFKYSWNNVVWHKAEVKEDNEMTLKSGDLLLNWGDSNTLTNLNSEDIVNATGARMLFKQDLPLPVCFVAFYLQIEVSNG